MFMIEPEKRSEGDGPGAGLDLVYARLTTLLASPAHLRVRRNCGERWTLLGGQACWFDADKYSICERKAYFRRAELVESRLACSGQ